jgi:ubiquinone/menaquinone biosynthesis C-methylase UbiE
VAELCCPTELGDYDATLLAAIPEDVIVRDYGCGDPTQWVSTGETVLDLGSGAGKLCFLAAQKVGPNGRVIGVDMNDDMLGVARAAAPVVAERIGYANVQFLKGRIEDLGLDREALDQHLATHPVRSEAELAALEQHIAAQRASRPLVANDSVDVVVSNCVLNLVMPDAKQALFQELYRVLRRGGRAVISDIVCDEDVPDHLVADTDLWSGCISGAFREDAFLRAFEQAGFHGIEILSRGETPWQVVEGIEFRSVTVSAYKGKQGACLEQNQAVIYKGPWKSVEDDDGHTFRRGERTAVCGKTHGLMTTAPYAGQVLGISPRTEVPEDEAAPFACSGTRLRDPRETKGEDYAAHVPPEGECCEPGECC